MRKRTQARESALQILYQHEMNPEPLEELIAAFWSQNQEIPEESRLFAESLVHGTLKHVVEIDPIIVKATENWDLARMAVVDRNILRFATYELLFRNDIPPKVAINEAVNLAKRFSQEESGKFVNGILDKIIHSEKNRAVKNAEGNSPDPA